MKKLLNFCLIVFIILLTTGYFSWQWVNKPVDSKDKTIKVFVVPQGQTANTIGKRLFQENLIKNELAFKILINFQNLDNQIKAGDFKLSPSMDLDTIINTLVHGIIDFWITFPEGWRTEQYAELLAEKSDINSQNFILAAKPYEGSLFPDTYLIPQNASAEDAVKILTDNFQKKFTPIKQNNKTNLSQKQIIIIASLIEREAKHEKDRFLISSVLHNRLNINMALQIDATVQYVLGKPNKWWSDDLSGKDMKIDSPYNTYKYPGFPPGPIANPGLASLKAAVNPSQTNYLYYVSDSSGYNHYAENLEEHQSNIKKYLK